MNRKLNKLKWDLRRSIMSVVCFFVGHRDSAALACGRPSVIKFCIRCMKVHLVEDLSKKR